MTGGRLVAVVPAYNEQATVGGVVTSLVGHGITTVVIDDASSDHTGSVAAAAGAVVITLPINLGVGGALRTGWRWAVDHGYDTAIQVDGDGQHLADEVAKLVAAADAQGLDLVIGTRFADGGSHAGVSWVRWGAMRVLAGVIRRGGKVRVTDPTSGFRLVRAPLLDQFATEFPPYYLGDTFEAVLVAARRGYRIGEVGVAMQARQGGTASADLGASVRAMVRALTVLLTGTSFDIAPREVAATRHRRT
jgi:glycosyltransferase involved in cell wall biosynthesis